MTTYTITNRDALKAMLAQSTMRIVFTKRDGTERTLICTRDMALIPEENHPKGVKTESLDSMPVWSIKDEGWRSFRLDAVTLVQTICIHTITSDKGS